MTFEEKLKPYEKWVKLAQEVLLLKRPVIFAALLLTVLGLFGFAKFVEAGFFASVCLAICALYFAVVFYAYLGSKVDKFLFSELPGDDPTASNRVRSLKELDELFGKYIPAECPCKTCCSLSKNGTFIAIGVSFALAVFFKFVPPFWFNLVVATLALALPSVLTLPPVAQRSSCHV